MIQSIDAQTLETLYHTHMKEAFPPEELKPLKRMLTMQAEGRYQVWGYYDEAELLAYACVYVSERYALLDYYATTKLQRGKGHGSAFLKRLLEEIYSSQIMLIEIEAVEDAVDQADRAIRERRLAFYERLGFRLTLTEGFIYSVHYAVLDNQPTEQPHSVKEAMEDVYRYFINVPEKYAAFVNIIDRA